MVQSTISTVPQRTSQRKTACDGCSTRFRWTPPAVVSVCGIRFNYCLACRSALKTPQPATHPSDGLTADQYQALLAAQQYACGICEEPIGHRALVIDHDHHTGRVRGLLCTNCNLGLGNFKDQPLRLVRAIKYLEGKLRPARGTATLLIGQAHPATGPQPSDNMMNALAGSSPSPQT